MYRMLQFEARQWDIFFTQYRDAVHLLIVGMSFWSPKGMTTYYEVYKRRTANISKYGNQGPCQGETIIC